MLEVYEYEALLPRSKNEMISPIFLFFTQRSGGRIFLVAVRADNTIKQYSLWLLPRFGRHFATTFFRGGLSGL